MKGEFSDADVTGFVGRTGKSSLIAADKAGAGTHGLFHIR